MPDVRGCLGNDVIRLRAPRSFCRARRSGPRVTSTVCTYVKLDPAPRSLSFSPCFLPGFPSRSCVPTALPLVLLSSLSISHSATPRRLFSALLARFPSSLFLRCSFTKNSTSRNTMLSFSLFTVCARAESNRQPVGQIQLKRSWSCAIAAIIRFYGARYRSLSLASRHDVLGKTNENHRTRKSSVHPQGHVDLESHASLYDRTPSRYVVPWYSTIESTSRISILLLLLSLLMLPQLVLLFSASP